MTPGRQQNVDPQHAPVLTITIRESLIVITGWPDNLQETEFRNATLALWALSIFDTFDELVLSCRRPDS